VRRNIAKHFEVHMLRGEDLFLNLKRMKRTSEQILYFSKLKV